MNLERITVNPQQCGGRPCIRGLRIRVQVFWNSRWPAQPLRRS